MKFNGTDGHYLNLGTSYDYLGTNDFSISGWFYLNEAVSQHKGIIGKWGDEPYFYVRINSDNRLVGVMALDSANNYSYSDAAVSPTTWHHFTFLVNRTGSNQVLPP